MDNHWKTLPNSLLITVPSYGFCFDIELNKVVSSAYLINGKTLMNFVCH